MFTSLNANIDGLRSSATDIVPTSAYWTNLLLSMSLILSLVAILLGIKGKRFLHQHRRRTAQLSQPRGIVLGRQAHLKAWADRDLGGTMSAIPALLKITMVLFLAGITIILICTLYQVEVIAATPSRWVDALHGYA